MPAVTRPMDVSCKGFGTRARLILSLTPAKRISASPNPTAYEKEDTRAFKNEYSLLIFRRHAPITAQVVVMSGKKIPKPA